MAPPRAEGSPVNRTCLWTHTARWLPPSAPPPRPVHTCGAPGSLAIHSWQGRAPRNSGAALALRLLLFYFLSGLLLLFFLFLFPQ